MIFFKSSDTKEYVYLYNSYSKSITPVHPLIEYFYNIETSGKSIELVLEGVDTIKTNKGSVYDLKTAHNVLKYYHYLKENIIHNQNKPKQILECTAKDIEYSIANSGQLTFEITDACNLNCKYCGFGDLYNIFDDRKDAFLNINYAKSTIKYMSSYWDSTLNDSLNKRIYISFYGGEPLMNFKFIEDVIEFTNQLKKNRWYPVYSMTTNGILLPKYIDFLVKKKVRILISMDGNKENNSYRIDHAGNNSFDRVYRNVKLIKQQYPEYYDKYVDFNSVLHNRNSVEDITTFFEKEFGKIPSISEINGTGISKEAEKEFLNTYKNKHESFLQAENYDELLKDFSIDNPSINELTIFLHRYSGNVYINYNDLLNQDFNQESYITTGTCFPFSKKIYITVNGKILPCERIAHCHYMGEVDENQVKIDFEEVAKTHNHNISQISKQCTRCFRSDSCMQCVYNIKDLINNPICYGFVSKEVFKDYLSTNLNFLSEKPHFYKKIMNEFIIE